MTLYSDRAIRGKRKWFMILVGAAIATLMAIVVSRSADAASSSSLSTETNSLGVWNRGVLWDMTNQDKYVSQVGKEPQILPWYQSWGPGTEGYFPTSKAEALYQRGYAQVLTWQSKDYTRTPQYDQPDYSLRTIINGDHDAYIHGYARSIASWGRPIMLRFDQEMNGDWDPWDANVNGNRPGEYIAAWKHVHDIFRQEGATNVEWVWSPAVKKPSYDDPTPFSAYYPGDAYVDWVALDGYNRGTSQSWSRWYSFAELFGPSYEEITSLTNKPMMIAETGSSEAGGDKAAWIRNAFLRDIPQKFPKIKAAIYWNYYDTAADYRLDSSSQALAAFKEVASNFSASKQSTTLSLSASPTLVNYNGTTTLTGKLATSSGSLPDKNVTVWRSTNDGKTWTQDGYAAYDAASGTYKTTRSLTANATFQLRFSGDASYAANVSPEVSVKARSWLSQPVTPSTVYKNTYFTTYGYLTSNPSGYTRLYFYRYYSGSYRYYTYVWAPISRYSGVTNKYARSYELPYAGYWAVQTYYDSDANHAANWSPAKVFYVR